MPSEKAMALVAKYDRLLPTSRRPEVLAALIDEAYPPNVIPAAWTVKALTREQAIDIVVALVTPVPAEPMRTVLADRVLQIAGENKCPTLTPLDGEMLADEAVKILDPANPAGRCWSYVRAAIIAAAAKFARPTVDAAFAERVRDRLRIPPHSSLALDIRDAIAACADVATTPPAAEQPAVEVRNVSIVYCECSQRNEVEPGQTTHTCQYCGREMRLRWPKTAAKPPCSRCGHGAHTHDSISDHCFALGCRCHRYEPAPDGQARPSTDAATEGPGAA